jgi:hypothetical protein
MSKHLLSIDDISNILARALLDNDYHICNEELVSGLVPIENFIIDGIQFYIDSKDKIFVAKNETITFATNVRELMKDPFFVASKQTLDDNGRRFCTQTCMGLLIKADALKATMREQLAEVFGVPPTAYVRYNTRPR